MTWQADLFDYANVSLIASGDGVAEASATEESQVSTAITVKRALETNHLINQIASFDNLHRAVKRVKRNKGGSGIDAFTVDQYPEADYLSKEVVISWCSKKSYEKQKNLCCRASIIRQFAYYLNSMGLKSYIIPKRYFNKGENYTPYIFTENELSLFFRETRKCHYCSQCPYHHLIMPLIFKMIYCCGLRVSEARLLKVEDVDLDRGLLSILHSKNDNSRLVPMPERITAECRRYSSEVHANSASDRYYFPVRGNTPMSMSNIYHNFRRFLWHAGISHRGRGFGPRIHDFRHAFAVHRLKKARTL